MSIRGYVFLLWFLVMAGSVRGLQCKTGYYLDSGQCKACHGSCETCNSYPGCTSCNLNYADEGNGVCSWIACPDGKYYSGSTGLCEDCNGSCSQLCAYQEVCFECLTGEYYDLDSMTCVSQCDLTKTIAVNDSMFGNRLVCRSFDYYVNIDSLSSIELGTIEHPYKDLRSAFVELLNLHANTEREITIYVKEGTLNYLYTGESLIVDILKVTITTYSDESNEADRATISVFDSDTTQAVYAMATKFNVLVNSTLYKNAQILNKVNSTYASTVADSNTAFLNYKSNVTLANFNIKSYYANVDSNIVCYLALSNHANDIVFENIDFSVSGTVFLSMTPPTVYFTNTSIDFYRNQVALRMAVDCDYPIANYFGILSMTNFTLYYSQERSSVVLRFYSIAYYGFGDIIINGFEGKTYNDESTSRPTVGLLDPGNCYLTSDHTRYLNITDMSLYIADDFGRNPEEIFTCILVYIRPDNLIPTQVNFRRFSAHDINASFAQMIRAYLGGRADMYIYDSTFYNITTVVNILLGATANLLYLQNVSFVDCIVTDTMAINAYGLNKVVFENVTMNGMAVSDTSSTGVIYLGLNQQATVHISGLDITSSYFSKAGAVVNIVGSGISTVEMYSTSFSDLILDEKNSLVQISGVSIANFDSLEFEGITSLDAKDDTNTIIDLQYISSAQESNITLSGMIVEQSDVSVLKVSNAYQLTTIDQYLSFTGITIQNCKFQYFDDLVYFGSVISDGIFLTLFDQLIFRNITFIRNGNLMTLEHQSNEDLIINNSTFYDIYFGGISCKSNNLLYEGITNVLVIDSEITDIDAMYRSFIELEEGCNFKMNNTMAHYLSTFESGSVLYAGYQYAVATIFNSTFANNTSIEGGVFKAESNSVIKCDECTLTNNFAIGSGVIKVNTNGFFQFSNSLISSNAALFAPVGEIFDCSTISIISGCTITDNLHVSASEILDTILPQARINPDFRNYIIANSDLLTQAPVKYCLSAISGSLTISGSTLAIAQDQLVTTTYSTFVIDALNITDVEATESLMDVSESTLHILSLDVTNVTQTHPVYVMNVAYSDFVIQNVKYSQSDLGLAQFIFCTQGLAHNWEVSDIVSGDLSLISARNTYFTYFGQISVNNLITTFATVFITDSSADLMMALNFSNVTSDAMHIQKTNVTMLRDVNFQECWNGIDLLSSTVTNFHNNTIRSCGTEERVRGGALHVIQSNIKISDSRFYSNKAEDGAAIYIDCLKALCTNEIKGSIFKNNTAITQGGAIYYNKYRPAMSDNVFENNQARYGENIGSYPVRVLFTSNNDTTLYLNEIASGQNPRDLYFKIVDYDMQVMSLYNAQTLKVTTDLSGGYIYGTDYSKFEAGFSTLSGLILVAPPGSNNVTFDVISNALDHDIISAVSDSLPNYRSIINASFRFCKPGEIEVNHRTCDICSYGTYTFEWNSTQCINCMDHAECVGGAEINVDNGYWRRSTNSTTIIECPREESCLGGYVEESEHPVECENGYRGELCAQCKIDENDKYELTASFYCTKCPNPTLNFLKVIGVLIIACAFICIIIVVNIRKKNENQFSILLRILTNYIHLISVALSFDLKMPTGFTSLFSQTNRVSSPNNTFFSFDCFIKDYELKAFTPSSAFFKLFLFNLLPIMLMLGIGIICLCLKGIVSLCKKESNLDLKRYMAISFICVIFLFHPLMTIESLSTFQCIKVDDGKHKMRMHLDYDCYSADHIMWASITGLPMLIIWVIGVPTFAFIMLYKVRHNLQDQQVKRYFLLLYQGLKENCFYWEFVNTLRKFITVMINVLLASYEPYYRIMMATVFLIAILRIQKTLKPYKLTENNEIEMVAIYSGVVTLYCGMVFTTDEGELAGFFYSSTLILFVVNFLFIIRWVFLLLLALNFKNKNTIRFLKLYASCICQIGTLNAYSITSHTEASNVKSKKSIDDKRTKSMTSAKLQNVNTHKARKFFNIKKRKILKSSKAKVKKRRIKGVEEAKIQHSNQHDESEFFEVVNASIFNQDSEFKRTTDNRLISILDGKNATYDNIEEEKDIPDKTLRQSDNSLPNDKISVHGRGRAIELDDSVIPEENSSNEDKVGLFKIKRKKGQKVK